MAQQPDRPSGPAKTPRAAGAFQRSVLPRTARKAVIDRLVQVPLRSDLGFTGMATVSAVRLLAMCVRCGRDPLDAHLIQFGCLETTRAFLDFADLVGHSWPDRVQVLRPCCVMLSPDEWTLAQMAERAVAGDREGFGRHVEGFIRQDRHDRIFDAAARLTAMLHQSALAGRVPGEPNKL
jgi:hypothetical protein